MIAAAPDQSALTAADQALIELGRELKTQSYRFITITPASHARVNERPANAMGHTLTDVFGWNRPFNRTDLPAHIIDRLSAAGALTMSGDLAQSAVRFSTIANQLFVHSAFPTSDADSVFFGPDTYRFVRAMQQHLRAEDLKDKRIVDIGAGSGAGGIALAHYAGDTHAELVLADLSPKALRFSRINAAINGTPRVVAVESDILQSVTGAVDVIVANPPYLVDPAARLYRNGGGSLGFDLSLRILTESIGRLGPGGRFILYTGAPVVGGVDRFREAALPVLVAAQLSFVYEEIDPDVFGEELEGQPYSDVDRIALVAVALEVR